MSNAVGLLLACVMCVVWIVFRIKARHAPRKPNRWLVLFGVKRMKMFRLETPNEQATLLAALLMFRNAYRDKDEEFIRRDFPLLFKDGLMPLSTEGINELIVALSYPAECDNVTEKVQECSSLL